MSEQCTICRHPDREQIEALLLTGGSTYREIAADYGVSTAALSRHKNNHLAEKLVKAQEAEEVAEADRLLEQLRDLQQRAVGILDQAEKAGKWTAATAGIREARQCLELLMKLAGQLEEQRQEQIVNVVFHQQWKELEAVILETLEPYPRAREDLIKRLEKEVQI